MAPPTRTWKISFTNNIYVNIKGVADVCLPIQQDGNPSSKTVNTPEDSNNSDADVEKGHDWQSRGPCGSGAALFDKVTLFAGTPFVLLFTICALLCWAIIGIVCGPTQVWQIVIQNTSSIQCYVSDTLLMRQQHNTSRDLLTLLCELRSRNQTCSRILHSTHPPTRDPKAGPSATESPRSEEADGIIQEESLPEVAAHLAIANAARLPPRNLYDRACDVVVVMLSSIYAPVIYWVGIFIWLGFGNYLQWSNNWQLYINSATAVELTFVSVFLQNTRQRHLRYLHECFDLIQLEDARLERRIRQLAGDTEPNEVVHFHFDYAGGTSKGNRAIDYYAVIIGSAVGLFVSAAVFSVWLAIGRPMSWSSNWWLIIGTYTGLVGFLDGFVLRNVYFRGIRVIDDEFDVLVQDDVRLGEQMGVELSTQVCEAQSFSIGDRVSNTISDWCARSAVVLGSCLFIVAVLVIATGMRWSETGQLICNTPTMIVEGFMLLVLVQAHNLSHQRRRLQFKGVLERRLEMNAHLGGLVPMTCQP